MLLSLHVGMKTSFALFALLALSLNIANAQPHEDECSSAPDCLQKAQAAVEHHHWKTAESLTGQALDWAEPVNARLSLMAFILASDLNSRANRPRMAFAWAEAGLHYYAPSDSNSRHPRRIPEDAMPALTELTNLHAKLEQNFKKLPVSLRSEGFFIDYAGRGLWNDVTLKTIGPHKVSWLLNSIEPGNGGGATVRESGPVHWSEDNEHVASRKGNVIQGPYPEFNYYDDSVKPKMCQMTLTLNAAGVHLADTPDCPVNNVGQVWSPQFYRVEATLE